MTKADAMIELEAVAAGFKTLYEAATEADDDCFWCCGGGNEWRDELEERKAAVLAEHPDLG